MQDSTKEEEQKKVDESLSSSGTREPEIVKSDKGIEAIRVPVIVSPLKSKRNINVQIMAENVPLSSPRATRHEDAASSSSRPNQPEKLIRIKDDTDDKPLNLSKISASSTKEAFLSTEKQHVAEKEDMRVLPEKSDLTSLAEISPPEEHSRRTSEQESKKSFHSFNINKMNENLDNFKRKSNEEISIDSEAKRRGDSDSASSRKTDENPRLPADSDWSEAAPTDYFSSRLSTSSGSSDSYDSTVNQKPSTSRNRESSFICDQCSKGFSSKYSLEKHYRSHTGEKAFECTVCSKKLSDQYHLKEHTLRIHTGERSHMCEVCGKLFSIKQDLNQHYRRKHIGVKPFPCTKCEKSFTDKYDLERHDRTHTGERPYVCEICGKAYVSNNILNFHKKKHHKSKET